MGDALNRLIKNPSGLSLGVKLLVAAGGLGYAATQSVYTGLYTFVGIGHRFSVITDCLPPMTVEGGHRAIIFSRIGGIQPGIYSEGLHFR